MVAGRDAEEDDAGVATGRAPAQDKGEHRPGAAPQPLQQTGGTWVYLRDLVEALSQRWNRYVVGYDLKTQVRLFEDLSQRYEKARKKAGADHGALEKVTRAPVAAGPVRVPVENRFLTFGGELSLAGIDATLTLAHLRSPAPIVRWGGHSQGTDPLTLAMGAFFGRLIVPVDFQPGGAARIDAAPPQVLFAAFLCDAVGRAASMSRMLGDPSDLDRWLAAAWARARSDPALRAAAEDLLADVGL